MSAFKLDTWLKKGFSNEEARYQIAIRRPSNYLYWINKLNCSEEEAKRLVSESQKSKSKLSITSSEEVKKRSVRCVEYWLNKGLSIDEAKIEITRVQGTFSLKKCIEKYGELKGKEVFLNRQQKWQETLNKKNNVQKDIINKKKNIKILKTWTNKYGDVIGLEKFKEYILKISGNPLPNNFNDLKKYVLDKINPVDLYLPIDRIKNKIPNYVWEVIEKPVNLDLWLATFINFKAPYGEIVFCNKKNKLTNGLYQMHVENKLLRSSNEIYFYQLLKEYNLKNNVDFIIEKPYNKFFRSDFYLVKGNQYVELLGSNNENYMQKMLYKESTFGCKLLFEQNEYKPFLAKYYEQYYNNSR